MSLVNIICYVLYLETIKKFLTEFYTDGENGKVFVYGLQLTKIAHREQTELVINLDDVDQVSYQSLHGSKISCVKLLWPANL